MQGIRPCSGEQHGGMGTGKLGGAEQVIDSVGQVGGSGNLVWIHPGQVMSESGSNTVVEHNLGVKLVITMLEFPPAFEEDRNTGAALVVGNGCPGFA